MAKEEELKRIDLKVNVSCCEGCRRKVMKAMSLKGVLRTEIKPSQDRVTVVGDVDAKVLVKKLAKVGKIAEALAPSSEADEGAKRRNDDGGKKHDYGDKLAPAPAEEKKSKGSKDGGKSASCRQECKKCAAGGGVTDNNNNSAREKAPPSKGDAAAARSKSAEEGDDGFRAVSPDRTAVQQLQQHCHRAEPAAAVPVHVPYYPPPTTTAVPYYYGYYSVPPTMMMGTTPRQVRPQPSRFDEDFFNDDNTVGCRVM